MGLAILALSGCTEIDPEQARLCRSLVPAFAPDTADLEVLGSEADPDRPHRILVRYRATVAGGSTEHWIACQFAGGGFGSGRQELTAVEDDRKGRLSPIQLQVLQDFWLGSTEPGPDRPADVPANLALLYFLQQLVNALVISCVYGLLALAYSLVYGLIGRINLAFGELATLGGFGGLLGIALAGALGGCALPLSLLLALLLAVAVAGLYGWATERLVFRPLAGSGTQAPLIATIGLAIFLQEYLRLGQGSGERWLQPVLSDSFKLAGDPGFPVHLTSAQIVIVLLTGLLFLLQFLLIGRSAFGRAWQACAQDPDMAALCGVDTRRTLSLTFVLAGAYAGIAGLIVTLYYGGVSFHGGVLLGFKALTAAIVGGIGSAGGALLGGLLIALLEIFWSAYLTIAYKDVAIFALLALMLALRPNGLCRWSLPRDR